MESFSPHHVLTLIQALQLVGLIPSLFVSFFLATLLRKNPQAAIPVGYFLSLACAFFLPLADIYPPLAESRILHAVLLFGESLLAPFSFLLILQFLLGRVPGAPYWLVLAIPLVGGSSLIYADVMRLPSACVGENNCLDAASYKMLYNILSASMVFLLLVYYSSRFSDRLKDDIHRSHKYWLIVALILLNLFMLAVELARLSARLNPAEADVIATLLRLAFIYLVITSIFRVFYPSLVREIITTASAPAYDPAVDLPHAEKIRTLLENDHIFREMRLNRAALAEKAGINEHHLSRVINRHFGKHFHELINHYRIEDAKTRLRAEPDTQITVIGFEVGFNSIASFNRVFKEKTGVSPTQWRQTTAPS